MVTATDRYKAGNSLERLMSKRSSAARPLETIFVYVPSNRNTRSSRVSAAESGDGAMIILGRGRSCV